MVALDDDEDVVGITCYMDHSTQLNVGSVLQQGSILCLPLLKLVPLALLGLF